MNNLLTLEQLKSQLGLDHDKNSPRHFGAVEGRICPIQDPSMVSRSTIRESIAEASRLRSGHGSSNAGAIEGSPLTTQRDLHLPVLLAFVEPVWVELEQRSRESPCYKIASSWVFPSPLQHLLG